MLYDNSFYSASMNIFCIFLCIQLYDSVLGEFDIISYVRYSRRLNIFHISKRFIVRLIVYHKHIGSMCMKIMHFNGIISKKNQSRFVVSCISLTFSALQAIFFLFLPFRFISLTRLTNCSCVFFLSPHDVIEHNFCGKVWMCGGNLEILPCSRVGHVFRKATPYSFPGGTSQIVNHNNARLVSVWLDEFADFYYSFNPGSYLSHTYYVHTCFVFSLCSKTEIHTEYILDFDDSLFCFCLFFLTICPNRISHPSQQ